MDERPATIERDVTARRADARVSPDDPRIPHLLQGAVDLHCHSGPSVMPRRLDHIDAIEEAARAGMRAVLFKDHHYSVIPITEVLEPSFAHVGVELI